jgi:hydrogenase nickel incorporation protein HypA/HybF
VSVAELRRRGTANAANAANGGVMHELGLCQEIVDAVGRRAAGRRVTGVRVRVGALHRVVEPALDQAFSLAAEGTVAEGAEVEMVLVPVRLHCRTCGHSAASEDPLVACSKCGGTDLDMDGGDELVLESIVLAAPERGDAHVPGHTG